ncbi:MAG: GmrSD restriction endonuclease domain-containing protein [Vagococcus fluvialis]
MHTLPNLTILTGTKNKQKGNKSFEESIEIIKTSSFNLNH